MVKTLLERLVDLPKEEDLSFSNCTELIDLLKKQLISDGESNDLYRIKGMRIIGQDDLVDRSILTLLLNEHILLEGLPGVAKTQSVKYLATDTGLTYARIQFIPDMQPSDLVGKNAFDILKLQEAARGTKEIRSEEIEGWCNGPFFNNFVVADEINRASSKVQASLLEGMGERQVTPLGHSPHIIRSVREWQMWLRYIRTMQCKGRIKGQIWGEFDDTIGKMSVSEMNPNALQPFVIALCNQKFDRFGIDFPFGTNHGWFDPMPMFGASAINLSYTRDVRQSTFATQNPIEQSGTFPMSEAQVDRFNIKYVVKYPDFESLKLISRMINRPQAVSDPDSDYVLSPEAELTADKRACRDNVLRASLYFWRRCGELLFGRPGNIIGSLLEKLYLSDNQLMDKMTKIVFYTHLKMPRTVRVSETMRLLLDQEQQQRMSYLHAHDSKSLNMLTHHQGFEYVNSGVSPRGIMALPRTALAYAFLKGQGRMTDAHIRAIAPDVLCHRIRLNSQARVKEITTRLFLEVIMDQILD